MNALRAGVKTIEHGSYLDEECAKLMKQKGAIFVATRLIVAGGLEEKELWPPASYEKLVKIASYHKKAYALAVKHEVKIALGTNQSTCEEGSFNSHGRNGKELFYAVEAGLTPLGAIEACTATSPETLGEHVAPRSGQLIEGFGADLIAVTGNPLENIKILADPANISHVWKAGKLYKSP